MTIQDNTLFKTYYLQVFMPQQYNCPIGMYSAGNVIDTFQNQAEVRMQDMER